ncbi:DivIVA domain-containing protein [Microbacterium resistens]|uniref:DivIVA domain-containing protein n=1 Tax=Microbacterium resistens TaxID=156977 RepID=A0ABU1S8R0_9MICO|nr:DivIVA domain-containing protein [Microbacterium resistens]MDR6866005.1 DivIVA domain-containing protein [Microbacterium resistens]
MTFSDSATDSAARTHFPLAKGKEKGYQRAAVDVFLTRAKDAFETDPPTLDSASIRAASFPVVRGGYQIADVDAALARVEDAFAQRERTTALSQRGARAWVRRARTDAQVILDHLGRPQGRRFARTGLLTFGYRIDEVDHVADRIVRYLRDGDALSAEQVRQAAFRMQRRGYREEQVDALLDSTIEVLLAVR